MLLLLILPFSVPYLFPRVAPPRLQSLHLSLPCSTSTRFRLHSSSVFSLSSLLLRHMVAVWGVSLVLNLVAGVFPTLASSVSFFDLSSPLPWDLPFPRLRVPLFTCLCYFPFACSSFIATCFRFYVALQFSIIFNTGRYFALQINPTITAV